MGLVCGALARGEGGEGELAVVRVGDAEEGSKAEAEGGWGEVEGVFDEVGVEGVGGARAAESAEADAVEGGGEVAAGIEEEGCYEAVKDFEEEGLGVPLSTKVEVGERGAAFGVTDTGGGWTGRWMGWCGAWWE